MLFGVLYACALLLGISNVQTLTVKICIPNPADETASLVSDCTDAVGLANTDDLDFICVEGDSPQEVMCAISKP